MPQSASKGCLQARQSRLRGTPALAAGCVAPPASGRVVIAKADAPVAHAEPALVRSALQPSNIALANLDKSGKGVEDAGRDRPIQSPEVPLHGGGEDDRPAHRPSSRRISSSVRTSPRASSSRASCTA
jgi:hypothetical protein